MSSSELPVFVSAAMPAPVGGRGDVTVTATWADGTARVLATWSDAVDPFDRLLLSRSPDGTRLAVALGKFIRTLDARDGAIIARAPIGHSEPSLVFGWPDEGGVVARDAHAPSGPDLPIGNGWTLRSLGAFEHDDGFSGGPNSGVSVPSSDLAALPADARRVWTEKIVADILDERAARGPRAVVAPSVMLVRDGDAPIPVDGGIWGSADLQWPPVTTDDAVLVRRSDGDALITESATEPGTVELIGGYHPWLVTSDGRVTTVPIELAVTPICVLPDGRYLLPGASESWRDDADEPMHVFDRDGRVEPWVVAGATPRAGRIVAALAPDLLPEVLPADPTHGYWSNDEGMWVQAGRVDDDGRRVVLLLAESLWWADLHQPEACRWLVAEITLEDGALRLVARGQRADGDAFTLAL